MHSVEIRVLSTDDWALYKSVRLAALHDSPEAFSATLANESVLSDQQWKNKLAPAEHKSRVLPLVALVNGNCAGLAFGVLHTPNALSGYVYQMWVSKANRGQGIGHLLLQSIIDWACDLKLESLKLRVSSSNVKGISFYQSADFSFVDEDEMEMPETSEKAQEMVLNLK